MHVPIPPTAAAAAVIFGFIRFGHRRAVSDIRWYGTPLASVDTVRRGRRHKTLRFIERPCRFYDKNVFELYGKNQHRLLII